MVRILLVLLLLAGFCAPCQPAFAGQSSANIPLDSWIYPALDKLGGLGLVASALPGSRPFTRLEAARQVLEASGQASQRSAPPVVRELLRRLEADLHQELVDLGVREGIPAATYFKPLADWQLAYLHKDGEDANYPALGTEPSKGRIAARQYSLNNNNFGIAYAEDQNAQLVVEMEARLGGRVLVNLRPMLLYSREKAADDESETDLSLLEGKLAVSFGSQELSIGRQALWWGQGRHGSLVLTNNAQPLDMVRLTNPSPVLLPWLFRALGPFRYDVFLSQLEEDRVVPEPWFGGLRVEFKPLPWLDLGASRTVMFGGEGRPSVGFSDFLTIVGGENLVGSEDTSNSIGVLDFRLRIPPLWGAEFYGEFGGEDEADLLGVIPFISNRSHLLGVYLPRIEPTGRASLRLEYADLSHIDDNSPVWYRHGIYQSGYTYHNQIIGHHAGGAAEDMFAELEILLPYDFTLNLGYDVEKRGVDQPVEERHRQTALSLRWDVGPDLFLRAGWHYDKVENFGYISGRDDEFHLAELAVGGRF